MKLEPINDRSYFRQNAKDLAKALIGKVLVYKVSPGITIAGIIVETEAYMGITDKASHSYGNKKTLRNEAMYLEGGFAYVYLCYGIHHLFNITANEKDIPEAVLIRAIEPKLGIEQMMKNRNMNLSSQLTNGPGKWTKAFGITIEQNKTDCIHGKISIFVDTDNLKTIQIKQSQRIGVDYAQEDALLPYRYYMNNNLCVSKY